MKKKAKRAYDATSRRRDADERRSAILSAARRVFLELGYTATTMPAIAKEAGVALDTVYASVGKKPTLFRLLVETSISGTTEAVPALDRDYVKAIANAPRAAEKIELYARAVRTIQPRLAPLASVLRAAARDDASLGALWHEIAERRARNMRLFARELESTGELRPELTNDTVADVIWSMNGPEYYTLLVVERGWSLDRFESWLADAWKRTLLA